MLKKSLYLLLAIVLLIPAHSVYAQDQDPEQPIYVVQPGDTLTSIAYRFGLDPQDLVTANPFTDPNTLAVGDHVIIPGIEGVGGILATQAVPFGETLQSLSRFHQLPMDLLTKINDITSPSELYAGVNLIVPEQNSTNLTAGRTILSPGQSLLELSVVENVDPWTIKEVNTLAGTWDGVPGDSLFFPSDTSDSPASAIHPRLLSFDLAPLPMVQGRTTVLKISTTEPISLSGTLAGNNLHFFSENANEYVALQGIYAMSEPGLYPLTLTGTFADGSSFSFEQMVVLESGGYVREALLGIDPATLDPAVTGPENELIKSLVQNVTPVRYWSDVFLVPGYDPNWITSWFGTRRTYNDDPKVYFHTGLDYGGGVGLPVIAPAPGIVVFANTLTVRGMATIIDHGWGVYSGFWHQSELQVHVGDQIQAGQQIGLVGGTGRVTGAHLHWEVWVNGVQVEPFDWLENEYP